MTTNPSQDLMPVRNNPDFPQKYSKPRVDLYHPEKYKDTRFRTQKPKYRNGQGNLIQPDV